MPGDANDQLFHVLRPTVSRCWLCETCMGVKSVICFCWKHLEAITTPPPPPHKQQLKIHVVN